MCSRWSRIPCVFRSTALRPRNNRNTEPSTMHHALSYRSAAGTLHVRNGLRCVTASSSATASLQRPNWNQAVSEAEKVIGYPSSFLSLRWLLSDEIANIALHMCRLAISDHPLLETTKDLLYNSRSNMQAWGLIVLLVSKAAGHCLNADALAERGNSSSGVLNDQRALAEIAEMIRTSHLMHNGIVNLHRGMFSEPLDFNDMCCSNKIAMLSGDYLLAKSYSKLAILKNQQLVELIMSGLRDLTESNFVGRRDTQNHPLPSPFEPLDPRLSPAAQRPFDPLGDMPTTPALRDWTTRNVLSAGSLLGKSCQGALILAGHGEHVQRQAFLFGKHLSLAWQAYLDLEPFLSGSPSEISFDLTSAPVLFQLEHDPSLFDHIDKTVNSLQDVDRVKIYHIVMKGPGIQYTKRLQKDHSQKATEMLNVFEESDARTALSNIIVAMNRE